jgi:hypothetical protein
MNEKDLKEIADSFEQVQATLFAMRRAIAVLMAESPRVMAQLEAAAKTVGDVALQNQALSDSFIDRVHAEIRVIGALSRGESPR